MLGNYCQFVAYYRLYIAGSELFRDFNYNWLDDFEHCVDILRTKSAYMSVTEVKLRVKRIPRTRRYLVYSILDIES